MNSSAYTPIYAQNEATAVDGSLLTTDLTLSSSLLADDKPAPGSVAAVPGQSLLSVTAPANLPEGYEFPVVLGQQQFMVQVPPGGVEVGQQFTVPMPCKNPQYRETATTTTTSTTLSIPVGHFRDGECDLFQYGACHLHCWTSCFCPLLAAGQVINRLQFTWRGTPARTTAASSRAFSILIYITIFHWIMFAMLEIAVGKLDHNDSQPPPSGGYTPPSATLLAIVRVYDFFKVLYWVLATWLLTNLRVSVREKYAIPGDPCNDCCYSFWCPCLVAGQMLRHTTDYDVYPSQLCSETGLAKSSAPVIV